MSELGRLKPLLAHPDLPTRPVTTNVIANEMTMNPATNADPNVRQAVPFLVVLNIDACVRYTWTA